VIYLTYDGPRRRRGSARPAGRRGLVTA